MFSFGVPKSAILNLQAKAFDCAIRKIPNI
jgi:hypothetical protein